MIEQGTEAWRQIRLGKVTASRVADVVAKTKTGWGASRANYQAELIAERLTSVPAQGFTSQAMAWGTEKEPDARRAYEFRFDVDVQQIGFVQHPGILMSGASPDGLVGDAGLVEFKCPGTAAHIDTLLTVKVPGRYVTQIAWQLACTGRQWCDFVSFDPRLPEAMQMFVTRIERDEQQIAGLEAEVIEFLAETDAKLTELTRTYAEAA